MNPVLYIYVSYLGDLDPYVALYCPSYDQIRKERERGREGGSRRDVTEEAKKKKSTSLLSGTGGRGVGLFLYLSTSFSAGNLSRHYHHYRSSQYTSALGR